MNKKIILSVLASLLLGIVKPVVAMHAKALRVVQVGTSAVVIGVYCKNAYNLHEEMQKPINAPEAPEKVKHMVHKGLAKLNVPNYEQVPVLQASYQGSPWAVLSDKVVVVDSKIAEAIVSGDEKIIAQGEAIKKHEFKHLLNGDAQKRVYAQIASPCVVQAVSSGLTYSFNKVVGRQQPKRILPLVGRSLVAVGAMGPKLFMSGLGFIAYIRYQEAQADKFAYEHAESREELEAFKGFFDDLAEENQQKMLMVGQYVVAGETKRNVMMRIAHFIQDSAHPLPDDRSAMAQEYLDKWDAEHKA
jgi:hypothetical protein